MKQKQFRTLLAGAAFGLWTIGAAWADTLNVGVVVSLTGPGAALGIPYRNVFQMLPKTLGGVDVNYHVLDDASDTTTGVKNARKLVDENKIDVLVGSGSLPVTLAMGAVIREGQVPQIALAPMDYDPARDIWTFSLPQPMGLMMAEVVDDMVRRKVGTVGYIGFADSWGDAVYKHLNEQAAKVGIKVLGNERYNRNDVSVIGQAVKLLAAKPDAVMVGGSGTPGALPHIAMRDSGYKGQMYNTHGSVSGDFLRVGGKSVEGTLAPAGPLLFADQLPAGHPVKPVAAAALEQYDKAYGASARSPFLGYAYDAYVLLSSVMPEVLKKAKPGSQAFRVALRDALEKNVRDVAGTQGVYSISRDNHNGLDRRARLLVQATGGRWVAVSQ